MILEPRDNLVLAEDFFKIKDYPAAANALRRECELLIKKNLPIELRLAVDPETGITHEDTKLESLYTKFISFLKDNKIDASFIKEFRFFQRNIFNALSHNDIIVPHYRKEVSAAIDFVKELRKIIVREILPVQPAISSIFCVDVRHYLTCQTQHYEITCLDSVYALKYGSKNVILTNPKCNVYHQEANQTWYFCDDKTNKLERILKDIWWWCKYPGPFDIEVAYSWIRTNKGVKLSELINI